MAKVNVHYGDNLKILKTLPDESVDLIYIDPPFNTQQRRFGKAGSYQDKFQSYMSFLYPRLVQGHRVLKPNGAMFVHLDYREVHRCKLWMDELFGGSEHFINEIIWAYDYGGRSKSRWSTKHDNILFYAKNPKKYTFNYEEMDRIPYMAPGLAGPEKAARGKTPTDTWWLTIVSPVGKEKTGYPTQKPIKLLERIVKIHSNPGDTVLDFFAGSGTTGQAALDHGRKAVLVDSNREAMLVMEQRFGSKVRFYRKGKRFTPSHRWDK